MWKKGSDQEESRDGFLAEEEAETRRLLPGQIFHWSLAFGLLFCFVFFFFWWSGSAIQFGAARVAEKPLPTWKVVGTVKNDTTGEAVPWATVRDSPRGRPPYFQTTAGPTGTFELLTLAEPHAVLVEAAGYHAKTVQVGRAWYVWWPKGEETINVVLSPE